MAGIQLRVFEAPEVRPGVKVSGSRDVFDVVKGYATAAREVLVVVYLDAKNKVLSVEPHSAGAPDSSGVYPSEIFKAALFLNASAFIAVHNHPSGDLEPSLCDKEITKALVLCGQVMGISLLDHLVIGPRVGGGEAFFSFSDNGLIEEYKLQARSVMDGFKGVLS